MSVAVIPNASNNMARSATAAVDVVMVLQIMETL